VVTDQCQLQTWKTFALQVDSTQHMPGFVKGPKELCVTNGVDTCLDVKVFDLDLLRDTCSKETLGLTGAVGPNGTITITPNTLPGQLQNSDTTSTRVCFKFTEDNNYFSTNPPPPEYVHLTVTDANGHVDTI